MKTCPNCNVTVTSEQRRCGNCGYALTPIHISLKKTEPINSPPPTYIPAPSPHPMAKPKWTVPRINLPMRSRLLIAGVLVVALIGVIVYMLTRPPQLAGGWYGTLANSQNGQAEVYAETYLNLEIGSGGVITGTGEYCTLAHNPAVKPGQHSSFHVTGELNDSRVSLALDANRFGGVPGSTTYAGTLSGQHLSLQLQLNGVASSIGMALQPGTLSAFEVACAA